MGHKGDVGSFWPHIPRITGKPQNLCGTFKFYDFWPDKTATKCNKHKGVFLTDPRRRKETTRFMIENCNTSNWGTATPSPFSYYPLNGYIGSDM